MVLESKIGCIVVQSLDVPDTILDLSSLTLNMNNQGFWNLSISVFSKQESFTDVLSDVDLDLNNFKVSNSQTFTGYIKDVSPNVYTNSEYIDYKVTGEGIVC